jgi:hypothetical protein
MRRTPAASSESYRLLSEPKLMPAQAYSERKKAPRSVQESGSKRLERQRALVTSQVWPRLALAVTGQHPALQRACACDDANPGCACGPEMQDKRMGRALVQPSLAISTPGDPSEREADRIANEVMRMPDSEGTTPRIRPAAGWALNRKCASCTAENATGNLAGVVARGTSGGAQALDDDTRDFMETRFGQDFATVQLYTSAEAGNTAKAIGARAYTVGRSITFAPGAFAPQSEAGRRLIAHELTHVVQQGGSSERIQRQGEDIPGARERGGARQPAIPQPDVVIDPTALSEPHCPRTPTGLGNLAPAAPCREDGDDIDGDRFQFCADSDVFSDPADLARLRSLVSGQPSGTSFRLRAFSSLEGPGTTENAELYNHNLSCHRLNRVLREFINLGVQEEQIDAVSMGPTDQFGAGVAAQPRNRVVVVAADPTQHAPRPNAAGMTMAQIRDAAKRLLTSGDYPLAADAYFARWSCGRWRTLAEATNRSTVLIAGQETSIGAGQELGTTAATGENTIVISPDISSATDPIGCAANRIADLTMHHASRPVLSNFADQHRAGMHLVFLAGLPECRIPLDPLNASFDVHARPIPVDPFLGFVPGCADLPLPGPLANQRGPATMETPPTFTVSSLTLAGVSGAVVPSGSNPVTVGVEPDSEFEVHATVDAAGAGPTVGAFEIGFVQTVMAESWLNTHVDGRRERRRFPLPLRDGPGRSDPQSEPPWFSAGAKVRAVPGANQVQMADAPNFRAFRFLPDLPTTRFVQSIQVARGGGGAPVTLERPTFDPTLGPPLPASATQAEVEAERRRRTALVRNVPDRGRRLLDFNTWVVARQKGAPATLGATQFLAGLRMTFRLLADWSSTPTGDVRGAGSYSLVTRAATDGDAAEMVLRGATPLDFVGPNGVPLFAEFLDIDAPLPRAQASGLPRSALFDAVRQISLPHRTGPTLTGEIIVRITVEAETGRVVLDTPDLQRGAIRILGTGPGLPEVDTPETRAFARVIFPEIRKLVAAPGFAPNEPQTGTMPIAVRLPSVASSP